MAGGISFGQALGLLGGVPVQPAGAMTIIERLRAAKSMVPGNVGGIMNMVLSQGPGSLLQNPIAAVSTVMQGQIGGMLGALGSLGDLSPQSLIQAIGGAGGLNQALGSLTGLTNSLSGLTGNGLMQLIGHANTLSMFGNMIPANIGLDTVIKPLLMESPLSSMVGQLQSIESRVMGGLMGEGSAIDLVGAMTGEIGAVVAGSNNALATLQNAALSIAQSAAAVSLIASGPPELAPIINMIVRDAHKGEIQSAMEEQIRSG
ncbi:hypothetical protein [uncultured Methylobacterium sp.]|jgi:hypothetical protein|uniref:hypothetical protein n=1 Tax=uncultured Methylobacterium sp. TaxID=157278 RepID=UPI00262A4A14|nr:hypothetical protein [uncultured Methylobacterium sp.]